jgi:DNA-binding response OmpR family regulator
MPSVMIVDDEPDILTMLEYNLKKRNLQAILFSEPVKALADFQTNHDSYSLIISDVRMPDMNGYELALQMRKLNANIKIILMSAFDLDKNEMHTARLESRVSEFIKKPFTMKQFGKLLDRHLPGHRGGPMPAMFF